MTKTTEKSTTMKMKMKTTSEDLDYDKFSKVNNKMAKAAGLKKPKPIPVLHRLIRNMTNKAYHATEGTWSSSKLKDVIDDEELFIRKHIKMEIPKEESEAFDTGTYFHTGVLEPHLMNKEIAVFEGKTRYGGKWDAFKIKNSDKCIITLNQKSQGDGMIEAVKSSPIAMTYLKDGESEVSLFVKLVVSGGKIYAPHYGVKMGDDGWVKGSAPGKGVEFILKVRADYLGKNCVVDLKSTSGRANKAESVRGAISKYKYDLSAALYLDIFSLVKEDLDFYWIFASKENPCCGTWIATRKQIAVGRAKWTWAMKRMADLHHAKWEVVDYLRQADPLSHELEWLETTDTDLL